MDVRPAVIPARLASVGRIVPVGGGKGGIGKSTVASLLALALADRGKRVGLFDLDFTGPSDHIILGFEPKLPSESFGIDPALHAGVHCVSIAQFSGARPVPLRGGDTTQVMLELLAITRWGELDALIVDLPPGIQDATLDVLRYLKRSEFLVVSNPSQLVVSTVRRTLAFLVANSVPILGVAENMARVPEHPTGASEEASRSRALAKEFKTRWLASIPVDPTIETCLGHPEDLRGSPAYRAVAEHLAPAVFPDSPDSPDSFGSPDSTNVPPTDRPGDASRGDASG